MKIIAVLNENNYIEAFAITGNLEGGIEIGVPNSLVIRTEKYGTNYDSITDSFNRGDLISYKEELKEEFYENSRYYKLENETLVFDNTKKIIEKLEKDISILEIEIIEKTTELEKIKNSMFAGTQKELDIQKELNSLKQKYLDLNHELGLQIENKLKEVY